MNNVAEIQFYIYANTEVGNNSKKYNTNVMVKKKIYIYNTFFTGAIKVYKSKKGYRLHNRGEWGRNNFRGGIYKIKIFSFKIRQ